MLGIWVKIVWEHWFFACCNCCFTRNIFSNAKSILYYIEVRDWSLKSALLINFLCIDSVSSEKLQQYFHKPRFLAFFPNFIKEATSMENMSQIHLLCFIECVLSHIIIYLGHYISVVITNFPYRCVNAPIQQWFGTDKVATITMTMFTWQCLVGPGTLPPVSSLPFN